MCRSIRAARGHGEGMEGYEDVETKWRTKGEWAKRCDENKNRSKPQARIYALPGPRLRSLARHMHGYSLLCLWVHLQLVSDRLWLRAIRHAEGEDGQEIVDHIGGSNG